MIGKILIKNKKSFSINLGKYKNKFSLLKEINTLNLFCAWIDSSLADNNFLDKLKREAKRKDSLNIK